MFVLQMSSIQNEVEELENVLDSLERTVIGDSSSLYGSSSDNDEEVVGPKVCTIWQQSVCKN